MHGANKFRTERADAMSWYASKCVRICPGWLLYNTSQLPLALEGALFWCTLSTGWELRGRQTENGKGRKDTVRHRTKAQARHRNRHHSISAVKRSPLAVKHFRNPFIICIRFGPLSLLSSLISHHVVTTSALTRAPTGTPIYAPLSEAANPR